MKFTVVKACLTFFAIASCFVMQAQELNCQVTVIAPDASKVNTDAKVFKTLEQAVQEFMNTRKWTSDNFTEDEKIECSVFIGITNQAGDNTYSASITVISKRPIFNSSYNSTVLNIIDNDFVFNYQEFQAIEFNENQFTSNLSHVLAYYAYLIIGTDYDTFSDKGGDKYLQKAIDLTNVVSANEASVYRGWKSYDKNLRNRYWIVTHTLNGRYEPYRTGMYKYYREGLDNFYDDPVLARANIIAGLREIAKVTQDNPNLSVIQMWSEAKFEEMENIFAKATPEELKEAVEVLKTVDPIHGNSYDALLKQ